MKYYELEVWQKAVDLSVAVYRCTAEFPKKETYGLQSQMRRASVSVPSNIAEGEGRISHKEKQQFLSIARGSILELLTQTVIAERLGYLDPATATELRENANEVGRLVSGSIRYVRRRLSPILLQQLNGRPIREKPPKPKPQKPDAES